MRLSRTALLVLTQVCVCVCPGANLTSSLDRIKIVFTPTLCRRVCRGGRCSSSCEKGDVTTVYSENHHQQQQQPKTQGSRLCECCPLLSLSLSLSLPPLSPPPFSLSLHPLFPSRPLALCLSLRGRERGVTEPHMERRRSHAPETL